MQATTIIINHPTNGKKEISFNKIKIPNATKVIFQKFQFLLNLLLNQFAATAEVITVASNIRMI